MRRTWTQSFLNAKGTVCQCLQCQWIRHFFRHGTINSGRLTRSCTFQVIMQELSANDWAAEGLQQELIKSLTPGPRAEAAASLLSHCKPCHATLLSLEKTPKVIGRSAAACFYARLQLIDQLSLANGPGSDEVPDKTWQSLSKQKTQYPKQMVYMYSVHK